MNSSSLTPSYRRTPLPIDNDTFGETLQIPICVVRAIDQLLPKKVRGVNHENVLYLAGVVDANIRTASMVIAPQAETSPGNFKTDRKSHQQVLRALSGLELEIVAQVHSHPGPTVGHSDGDDELAFIKGEGFWSLVIPNYCGKGMLPIEDCGIHCYTTGQFRILDERAVSSRVHVIPDYLDLREDP